MADQIGLGRASDSEDLPDLGQQLFATHLGAVGARYGGGIDRDLSGLRFHLFHIEMNPVTKGGNDIDQRVQRKPRHSAA